MFASSVAWVVLVLAFAAAMTVIFPSVKPVNALGGIGVLSIAAGIAFQTVLGNMFAGIVILARDVFRVDDQIAVGDTAGTVTAINLTSTVVRTYDGRLVLIPNSVIHSEIVTVQTGYEHVRNTISVDIDDAADLDLAVEVAERAMARRPGGAAGAGTAGAAAAGRVGDGPDGPAVLVGRPADGHPPRAAPGDPGGARRAAGLRGQDRFRRPRPRRRPQAPRRA